MTSNDNERESDLLEVEIQARQRKKWKYLQDLATYNSQRAAYQTFQRERRRNIFVLGSRIAFALTITAAAIYAVLQWIAQSNMSLVSETVIAVHDTKTQNPFVTAIGLKQVITNTADIALIQTRSSHLTLTANIFAVTAASTETVTPRPTNTFSVTPSSTRTATPWITSTIVHQFTRRPPTRTAHPVRITETYALRGIVIATRLNVRSGPGPEYSGEGQLNNGDSVTIIGRNSDNSWVQISGTNQRWLNVDFLHIEGVLSRLPITFIETGAWQSARTLIGITGETTTVVRIRGGPGTNFKQLENPDVIEEGEIVNIVGKSRNGEWYQVNIDTRSGWISGAYVRLVTGSVNRIPVTE